MINMSLRYILNLTVVVPNKHTLCTIELRSDTKELSGLIIQHTLKLHIILTFTSDEPTVRHGELITKLVQLAGCSREKRSLIHCSKKPTRPYPFLCISKFLLLTLRFTARFWLRPFAAQVYDLLRSDRMKTPHLSSKSRHGRIRQSSHHHRFQDSLNSPSPRPSTKDRGPSIVSWINRRRALTNKHYEIEPLRPVASSVPLRAHVSPSKTGEGSMTRFVEVPDDCLPHAQSRQAPSQSQHGTRGTGAHDDSLTRSQGNYRAPSLRRGSGMVVETPRAMRKAIGEKRKNGEWSANSTQAPAMVPTPSNSRDASKESKELEKEPLAKITDVRAMYRPPSFNR